MVARGLLPWLAPAVLLAGCALKQPPDAAELKRQALPNTQVPERWASQGAAGGSVQQGWFAQFAEPRLTPLVEEALVYNADLRVAGARIEQAAAYTKIAAARLYPAVSLLARLEGESPATALAEERARLEARLQSSPRDLPARRKLIDLCVRAGDPERAFALVREGNVLTPRQDALLQRLIQLAAFFGDRQLELEACRTRLALASGLALALLGLVVLTIGSWYDLRAKGTTISWLPFAVGIPLLPVFGWFGAAGSLPGVFLVLVPAAANAGTALAIANAIVDVERDEAAGIESIATALGLRRSGWLVIGLQGVVALLALATAAVVGAPAGWAAAVLLTACVPLVGAGIGVVAIHRGGGPGWRELAWQVQAVGAGLLAVAWLGALSAASGTAAPA